MPVTAGEPVQGGSLLLSEIMSDPDVAGDNNLNEWVEVFNQGTNPVDLGGWVIADRHRGIPLPSLVVPPGEFAVIAAREAVLPDGIAFVRLAGRIGNGLRNPGEAILLYAPDGTLVDAMSYGDNDSYGPGQPDAPPRGETLGRAFGDSGPGQWTLTLMPTPGQANQFPPFVEDEDEDHDDAHPTQEPPVDNQQGPVTPAADDPGPPASSEHDEAGVAISEGSTGTSPVAWLVFGAAAGAAIMGSIPLVPGGVKRLKELRRRGG